MSLPQIQLLNWYLENHRKLPWRQTHNPYIIWLSEVILQQTRVEQGLPYFEKFLRKFPTLELLAAATEEEVLIAWQGLGYYSRARNMLQTATEVWTHYKGEFPSQYKDLIRLRGIGPYTAAAIASFSRNEPVPVVDGNVNRVLARYHAVEVPVQSAIGKRLIFKLADDFLNREKPGLHNQAIMELGSLICKPTSPKCAICPLSNSCMSFQTGKQDYFPVKTKGKAAKPIFFYYFLFNSKGKIGLIHRPPGDIWQHLYDLPLITSQKPLNQDELRKKMRMTGWFEPKQNIKQVFRRRHILTHRRIDAVFYRVAGGFSGKVDPAVRWIKERDLEKVPVSRLLEIFFNEIHV